MRGAPIAILWTCCCLAFLGTAAPAVAAACRNPQALGTSRTITIAPGEYTKLGDVHYSQFPQLPLRDHEVVLTFDDGPLSPFSDTILDALAHDCVKATFFLIGRQATAFPAVARRIYNDGHTIGTHSQNHPLTFDQMPLAGAQREIDDGIASVGAALGDPRAVAPFFRIPGFLRVAAVEDYLNSRSITVWSTDIDADDWYRNATPQDIVTKAMTRLETKKRGIVLLHDVHPATAMAVPMLLQEFKSRGYRIVAVVPAGRRPKMLSDRVAEPTPRPQSRSRSQSRSQSWPQSSPQSWPRVTTRASSRWKTGWR